MTTYYERNKESILKKRKERYQANRIAELNASKQWRQENPEKFKVYRKAWESKSPEYIMYHNAKRRAKEFGLVFELDWKLLKTPDKCPVLGIPLCRGTKTSSEFSPSLDRLVPELGYTQDNVRIISSKANRIKSNSTVSDLEKIIHYMKS